MYNFNSDVYDSGDKIEDFGKSRCWGSISWGIFSIFGGALIDYFSVGDLLKNYIPIYYLCLTIILCDFAIAYKIKVSIVILIARLCMDPPIIINTRSKGIVLFVCSK